MAFGLFLETVAFAVPMKLENWFQILGIEMPRKKPKMSFVIEAASPEKATTS